MKIAMIGHKTVPSRDGGVEIVVEELATRMVQRGHEVVLFNRKRKNKKKLTEYKGCKLKDIFTINMKSLDAIIYSYFATKRAIKMAKKGELDIVHFHAEGPCNFLNKFGKLSSNKRKKMPKIIVTIHGLDWQRNKWGGFATKILLRGEKMAVKYADEVIVLSQNNRNYFTEKYKRNTVYIPNGVAPAEMCDPEQIKSKWGLERNKYILFLARIVPEKGLHYLIDAWKKIQFEIKTDKKLVIAGGSSHSDDYYNNILKMTKNDESIIMTGFVTGKLLQELFSNAYLYVLPSDIEGMPMSLLEAMAYGNTCLVSNIPENTEIIRENDFVFEKGNVDSLKEQLRKIICMDLNTHQAISLCHSWEDVVTKTLEVYSNGETKGI